MDLTVAKAIVYEEYRKTVSKYPPMHSAHEGYAVIFEEVRELEQEVFKNPIIRDKELLCLEAKQVAAMAIRFLVDCT